MAKQRKSQTENAQGCSMIDLLNSPPATEGTGIITTNLILQHYEKLLKVVENPGERRLRADFENPMPTTIQGAIRDLLGDSIGVWLSDLAKSNDPRVSDISKTILPLSSENLAFGEGPGPKDVKTPGCEVRHVCDRGNGHKCEYPNLVFGVGWTQTKKQLNDKAEYYGNLSKGEVRTIVAVYMHEIFLAERKNEIRLKRMYRKGKAKESYRYWKDEDNQTGSAAIILWRAIKKADGTIQIRNAKEKIFRDLKGNAIRSGSLRIPGRDFICAEIAGTRGQKLKMPSFEISSDDLCERIQESLMVYRKQRSRIIRREVEREERKLIEKKEKEEERLRLATEVRRVSESTNEDESFLGRRLFHSSLFQAPRLLSARIKSKEGHRQQKDTR
ncbi:hypothetical protein F5Y03DRAFT_405042 [Xylaria venustula]|nr:hypothetical protein F5Y03DRAFT_405042 [Xylaria venustula]